MIKSPAPEASPAKSLAEELDYLRKQLREAIASYGARLEGEIVDLKETTLADSSGEKLTPARARDLRDMLGLLRTLSLRPDKGRRKDLRRIESTLADLRSLTDTW